MGDRGTSDAGDVTRMTCLLNAPLFPSLSDAEFSPAAWGVVTAKRKLLKADQFNPDAEDDDDDDLLPPPSPPLSRFEAPEPSVPAAEPEHRRHSSVPQRNFQFSRSCSH